jgi:hypothetical protein
VLVATLLTARAFAINGVTVEVSRAPRRRSSNESFVCGDAVAPAKQFAHLTGARGQVRRIKRGDQSG